MEVFSLLAIRCNYLVYDWVMEVEEISELLCFVAIHMDISYTSILYEEQRNITTFVATHGHSTRISNLVAPLPSQSPLLFMDCFNSCMISFLTKNLCK
jgi:hypothetical protein